MGFWERGPSSLLEVGLHHSEPLVDTERDLGEARKEDAKAHRARSTPLMNRQLTTLCTDDPSPLGPRDGLIIVAELGQVQSPDGEKIGARSGISWIQSVHFFRLS